MNHFQVATKTQSQTFANRVRSALVLACLGTGLLAAAQSPVVNYVGTINTVAGSGTTGTTGDNGPATSAKMQQPVYAVYDAQGNLFIADYTDSTVRKVAAGTGTITLYAGVHGALGYNGDGIPANTAELNHPYAIAVDGAGNVYIADRSNYRIRKVSAVDGTISTVVGDGTAGFIDNVAGTAAEIKAVNGLAVDTEGNLYITDTGNYRVRELVAATGKMTTIAGTGANTVTGDGGLATKATVGGLRGVSVDTRGNIFLDGTSNANIRVITPDGIINTYAGTGAVGSTGDGGKAIAATVSTPFASASDLMGNLYFDDGGNYAIRAIDAETQSIFNYAGREGTQGSATLSADGDGGLATAATLRVPNSVALSPTGKAAIPDQGTYAVREVSLPQMFVATNVGASSAPTTYTAQVVQGATINSLGISPAAAADFTAGVVGGCVLPAVLTGGSKCAVPVSFTPTAPGLRTSQVLTVDNLGNKSLLGITGVGNAPAVAITPGVVSTFAGTTGSAGSAGDGGQATAATLTSPVALAFDSANNLYLAGSDNKVRMVSAAGVISTLAGTGAAGFSGDQGAATSATLKGPSGLALDPQGNVYIADSGNNVVRAVGAQTGVIRTVTQNGLLNGPRGLATDATGNLYIADTGNNVVRVIGRYSGLATTLAGAVGTAGRTGDGGAATNALLNAPGAVAVDVAGNVYIADTGNNVVRKITLSSGLISTVAGNGTAGSAGDGGAAISAAVNAPSQLAVDAAGDLYIAEAGGNRVRMVNAAGVIQTVAGTGTAGATGDGGLATAATLRGPMGVALDAQNDLVVADTGNQRVVRIPGTTTTLNFGSTIQGRQSATQAVTVTNFGNLPLTLSALTASTNFTVVASGTGTDCTATTTLVPGAQCVVGVQFTPTTTGALSGTLTLTDNALNVAGSKQTVALTGTGSSAPASVVATAGSGQTAVPYATFALPLTATVLDVRNSPVSNVSVVFTAPATGASGTFANGLTTATVTTDSNGQATASFTAGGTRGSFTVSASTSGVSTPATFAETIAGNPAAKVVLSYAPATNPSTYGQPVTLTATLSPPAPLTGSVTGTVTFYDGATAVANAVTVAANSASLTLTPNAGSHSFTAVYSGDANYNGSTSNAAPLVVNQLAITAVGNSVSLPYGTTPWPVLTGTLQGVLPADAANVSATFASAGLVVVAGVQTTADAGVYPITVSALSGSAAGNYTVSSVTGSVTITKAMTTSVLTQKGNLAPGPNTALALADVITSSVTGQGAGSGLQAIFYDNGVMLATGSKSGVGGQSNFTGTLPVGTHQIYAVFPGNNDLAASTSNTITVVVTNPGIVITFPSSTVTVVQGSPAAMPMTIATQGGLNTAVTFTCSGNPVNSNCIVLPGSFTPTPDAATPVINATGSVQVLTGGPGLLNGSSFRLWVLPMLLVMLVLGRKRRWLQALVVLVALAPMSGCGNGVSQPLQPVLTPVGTSTVTVTATSGAVTGSGSFTLVVVAKQ